MKLPNLETGSEASVRLHRIETMDSTPETHRKERKKLVLRLLEIAMIQTAWCGYEDDRGVRQWIGTKVPEINSSSLVSFNIGIMVIQVRKDSTSSMLQNTDNPAEALSSHHAKINSLD